MTEIKIGDAIVNNDPRSAGPRLVVAEFVTKFRLVSKERKWVRVPVPAVRASRHGGTDKTSETTIRLDRIHTDGKVRRSGWRVVAETRVGVERKMVVGGYTDG